MKLASTPVPGKLGRRIESLTRIPLAQGLKEEVRGDAGRRLGRKSIRSDGKINLKGSALPADPKYEKNEKWENGKYENYSNFKKTNLK